MSRAGGRTRFQDAVPERRDRLRLCPDRADHGAEARPPSLPAPRPTPAGLHRGLAVPGGATAVGDHRAWRAGTVGGAEKPTTGHWAGPRISPHSGGRIRTCDLRVMRRSARGPWIRFGLVERNRSCPGQANQVGWANGGQTSGDRQTASPHGTSCSVKGDHPGQRARPQAPPTTAGTEANLQVLSPRVV